MSKEVKLDIAATEIVHQRIKIMRRPVGDIHSGIRLVPLVGTYQEIKAHHKWFNDPRIRKDLFSYTFCEWGKISSWIERINSSKNEIIWGIRVPSHEADGSLIGNFHMEMYDGKNFTEPGVVTFSYIVDANEWNNGYATTAGHIFMKYMELSGVSRVETTVWEGNVQSIAVLKKMGLNYSNDRMKSPIESLFDDQLWAAKLA